MNPSGYTRLLKLVIFVGIISVVVVSDSSAATDVNDSIRTVSQFGRRVFHNLNLADTMNGIARYDSASAQQDVRDAVVEVGDLIPPEKAKTITTVNGTFGYLIDTHLDSLRGAMVKKSRSGYIVDVVTWYKLMEALRQTGTPTEDDDIKYAAHHGDSVYLYPIPASVDTVYLFYTARGSVPYSDTCVVDLPHELYTAVEYLATVKGAADIENLSKLQIYQALYDREIAKFLGGKKPQ